MTALINLAVLGLLALVETARPLAHATLGHRLVPVAAAALLIGVVALLRQRVSARSGNRRRSRPPRRSY